MHEWMTGVLQWYFAHLESSGLLGIVVLMAMERSIFPVPSELVVPPAAYLFARDAGGLAIVPTLKVIIASTLGSYLGAAITYLVARWLGRPLIVKYGKYVFIPEKKLQLADAWMVKYGAGGVFLAALLPVVRHLISIPAAIVNMRFRTFSIMTVFGAFLWCTTLAIFGRIMAKDMNAVLTNHADPEHYKAAFNNLTLATVALVVVVGLLYIFVVHRQHPPQAVVEEESTAEV